MKMKIGERKGELINSVSNRITNLNQIMRARKKEKSEKEVEY